MRLALVLNSVVCLLGVAGGAFLAMGSIISIANMTKPWAGALIVAAFGVPLAFAISGIGAWVAMGQGSPRIAIALIALPWIYLALFVAAMLVSF